MAPPQNKEDGKIEVITAVPAPVMLDVVYTHLSLKVEKIFDLFVDILSKKTTEKPAVDFDLEYTTIPKGEDHTVAIAQLCMEN